MLSINEILSILKTASDRLPQLKFTWGLLSIAAVASLTIQLLGANKAAIIVIGLTIIGTVIVFVASIAFGKAALALLPAQVLIWSIIIFFVFFLTFTVTAFASSWPCNWVRFLEVPANECSISKLTIIKAEFGAASHWVSIQPELIHKCNNDQSCEADLLLNPNDDRFPSEISSLTKEYRIQYKCGIDSPQHAYGIINNNGLTKIYLSCQ